MVIASRSLGSMLALVFMGITKLLSKDNKYFYRVSPTLVSVLESR